MPKKPKSPCSYPGCPNLCYSQYCDDRNRDLINFKTCSKNFKNKKRIPNNPENWKIFENVHEPIIDRDTFNLVQEHIFKGKRRAPKKEYADKNMLLSFAEQRIILYVRPPLPAANRRTRTVSSSPA